MQKRRIAFLEVGLIEIGFVVISLILIFGTLNYFSILSLSELFPKYFGKLPQKQKNITAPQAQTNPIPTPKFSAVENPKVSASSEVKAYKLSIQDKDALILVLSDLEIWGRQRQSGLSQQEFIELR